MAKYWVQFLQESTGCVPGTIPPQFDATKKRLIDACGSDSVFVLDGRLSAETMRQCALKAAQRLEHIKQYKAFQICVGPRLYTEIKRGQIHKLTYPIHV